MTAKTTIPLRDVSSNPLQDDFTYALRSYRSIGMIIDLSRAIENDVAADPAGFGPVVE